jgi:hypothetical protein
MEGNARRQIKFRELFSTMNPVGKLRVEIEAEASIIDTERLKRSIKVGERAGG